MRQSHEGPGMLLSRRSRLLGKAAAAAVFSMGAGAAWGQTFNTQSSTFDLAIIPDTQLYTKLHSWNVGMTDQMNWIVNNTTANNVVYTLGMGDIVQDGVPLGPQSNTETFAQLLASSPNGNIATSSTDTRQSGAPTIEQVTGRSTGPFTNQDYMTEWTFADSQYKILDNHNLPYYAPEGRHDYWHWGVKNTPQAFLNYFGPQRYTNPINPVVGSPAVAGGDMTNPGLDTFSFFNAGGYKFMNLTLQFDPDSTDMTWAQSVINAHPGLPTILTTADALDPSTAFNSTFHQNGSGQFIWKNLIKGNKQIFMLLAGHIDSSVNGQPVDTAGDTVSEILTDYETDSFSGTSIQGGGVMRTLHFDLTNDTVAANTFATIPGVANPGAGSGATANDFTLSFNTGSAETFQQRFGQPSLQNGLTWDPKADRTGSGGAGTWDNSTANWFNGAADVAWDNSSATFGGTGGAVNVGANVSATGLTFKVGGYTLSGTGSITLTGGATIDESGGQTVINNVIAGSAGVNVVGGGTGNVTFGGSNTFTGGLTIKSSGNVLFSSDANLGAAGGAVTIAGGTLTYTGTTPPTVNRPITIGAGGANIDTVNNAGTGKMVITGVISGAGNLIKTGPGWLTMYGANTTTGTWSVNAGVVEAGNTTALGSGDVTINSGAELGNNAPAPIANNITLNAGSTIGADYSTANSTGTFSGNVNVAGPSTVRLGNFWSNLSQNVTVTGNLSGSGTLTTALGAGASPGTVNPVLSLQGDNSAFSGGFNISAGTTVSTFPTATKPLGSGTVTLSGGTLRLAGQVGAGGTPAAIAPVGLRGFNADTIYGATDTGGTTTTHPDGSYSLYQNGYNPAGTALTHGIPGQSFNSASLNTVYQAISQSVNTPFTLQAFNANNSLQIGEGGTGTLNFSAPTAYANIAILANSAFGSATETPVATIYFQDGTALHTTFKAFDWLTATGNAGNSAFGSAGVNRYSPTSTPNQDTHAFNMYETDLDLTNVGGVDYSFRPISAITFNGTTFDTQNRGQTEVYAVSGAARTSTSNDRSGVYGNNVNVTADSTVEVDGLDAIMGTLSIGSNTLTVSSPDDSGQPYVLAFTSTTIATGANPVFNVQRSATNGIGTLVLNTSTGQNIQSASLAAGGAQTFNSLSVIGGTVALQPHGGTAGTAVNTSAVHLSGTGTLNLTNNDLVIHQTGPAAEASLRAMLASAYHNGAWDGAGLTSSGAGGSIELGYADTSELGISSFDGQSTADPVLVVKLASIGDTNLDGSISQSDISNVLANYDPLHIKPQNWSQGDFNYDGYTDNQDLNQLMALYNSSGNSPITLGEFDQLQAAEASGVTGSAVPEPASLSLLAIGATALLGRRSRRRQTQIL